MDGRKGGRKGGKKERRKERRKKERVVRENEERRFGDAPAFLPPSA
jgi:hypothetical protein